MNLNYVRLLTDCFDEMVTFYRDKLGFEVRFVDDANKYAEFSTEGATLAIFDREKMEQALGLKDESKCHECSDPIAVIFRTDDVDSLANRFKENGIVLLSDPTDRPDWSVRTFHLRDPSGNLLEFNQPIKNH
ncbi:MAG: VOC family protein [Methanobacteriota archaeon]|nr:MAG: VOC family protein [Euryarchaeota archaeon]